MGWLAGGFINLAAFFGIEIAKRVALVAAGITASLALALGLTVLIQNLIVALVVSVPAAFTTAAFFLPYNTGACLSAIVTAKLARWYYDKHMAHLFFTLSSR